MNDLAVAALMVASGGVGYYAASPTQACEQKAAALQTILVDERAGRSQMVFENARLTDELRKANLVPARVCPQPKLHQPARAAAPAAPAPASDVDAARRASLSPDSWNVVGECTRTVQALAEAADASEQRLIQWQKWWAEQSEARTK